ncbi:recombination protein RecR [Candidatus Berkelbacteria bacterium]|nr:recombination protein RecR [Candidatus Berkelbacteria bacterium]
MSSILPKSIQTLIDQFTRLPGIGPKMASRLTFWLLTRPEAEITDLAGSIAELKHKLTRCEVCGNIAEVSPCAICGDPKRETAEVMVVEEPLDIVALEKTGYSGRYHVLGGVISPIDGIGPAELNVASLLDKLRAPEPKIKEVILATDPSLEGEATAMYIDREIIKLKEGGTVAKSLKVTRIARGLPVGGDLEYADEVTLSRALEGRKEY